jgi:thiol:disulfide interchange protein
MKTTNVIAGILLAFAIFVAVYYSNAPKTTPNESAAKKAYVNTSNYLDYSEANLTTAHENGQVVLFFAANWCSSCTILDDELINSSSKLSPNVTVLKADFDNNRELKRKYNVLVQHTLVVLDENNNEVTKWVGGGIEDINKNLAALNL